EHPFYRIESENGSLDFGIRRVAADGDLGAFLAVDLYRERQRVLDLQAALDLRPGRFRDQRLVAEHGPAFLREVRHHRVEQLHQNVNRFARRPAEVGGAPFLRIYVADRRPQRVGELVDRGHTDIKV